MTDYLEIVTARVVTADGTPVPRATVRVYDKDLIVDDHLGTAETDADGSVRIEFRWSDYKDSGFEGRPDVFLKIQTPSGGETRTKVFEELEGVLAEDDSEEVMDLGNIVVTP
jgi:hypothetical protein